jgi:hypothetical protein
MRYTFIALESGLKVFVPFFYGAHTLRWIIDSNRDDEILLLLIMWALSVFGLCVAIWKALALARARMRVDADEQDAAKLDDL